MGIPDTSSSLDFTTQPLDSISQSVLNIIEFNTGNQTDSKNGYTAITWLNGVPTEVKKYTDNTLSVLTDTIAITWLNGVPTTIIRTNHLDIITVTTTIAWVDGVPVSVTKV